MLVKAVFTDVNNVAVRIENVPSFRAVGLALLTKFAVAVIAVVAVKPVGNFFAARNAQAVGTNSKSLEIESVIVANGNFGVEVPVRPVRIAARTDPPLLPTLPPSQSLLPKHFSMDVELDKTRLNKSFNAYIDEVASYLMHLPNASVSIHLAINISAPEGIPEDLNEVISENCHTLKVRNFYFEN